MIDIEKFKQYLDEKQIQNEIFERGSDNGIYKYVVFKFPVAREFEEIRVYDDDKNLSEIMQSDFSKYRGIKNYEAIWSAELGCIECEVQEPRLTLPVRFLMRRLAKSFKIIETNQEKNGIPNASRVILFGNDNIRITVGCWSKEFAFLSSYKEGRHIDLTAGERLRITLKIENVSITTEKEARSLLETIANSLFYQINVLSGYSLVLAARRLSLDKRFARAQRGVQIETGEIELKLDYEYDKVPMSLYWFAESNTESPIFMYFALYQVLEYYYPIYSTIEIKERIRNLMKEPGFNVNLETDMMRLLTIMEYNNINSLGDEREQLDNVLRHIVTGEDISHFVNEREYLKSYYTGKEYKKLSDRKLRLDDKIGIIDDLAVRIYDIRCSIVHNKASELSKKILPITNEEYLLRNEIELLKYVVQKAITVNSTPLSLGRI